VVQILRLGDKNLVGFCILIDDVVGPAHSLNSSLEGSQRIRLQNSKLIKNIIGSFSHLLQLIDVLGLLEVELKDVEDSSVQIQYCRGDSCRGEYLSNHTISILKLDGNLKLSSQS